MEGRSVVWLVFVFAVLSAQMLLRLVEGWRTGEDLKSESKVNFLTNGTEPNGKPFGKKLKLDPYLMP